MVYHGLMVLASILAGIAMLAAVRIVRRRRRALSELLRGLASMTEGRRARPVATSVGGRLGEVARSFNEVAPRLEARLATLEGDRQLLGAVLGGMTEGVIAVD